MILVKTWWKSKSKQRSFLFFPFLCCFAFLAARGLSAAVSPYQRLSLISEGRLKNQCAVSGVRDCLLHFHHSPLVSLTWKVKADRKRGKKLKSPGTIPVFCLFGTIFSRAMCWHWLPAAQLCLGEGQALLGGAVTPLPSSREALKPLCRKARGGKREREK